MNIRYVITVPTMITLVRLVVAPLVMPILVRVGLPYGSAAVDLLLAVLFVLLGATDFFDGYIARSWGQESVLGRFLDPLADKFLVFSTVIALVAVGRVSYVVAIIIIGREFFVMGLREFALLHRVTIPVMWEGKVKTALQLIYIALMILGVRNQYVWVDRPIVHTILIAMLAMTIYSALVYYEQCVQRIF